MGLTGEIRRVGALPRRLAEAARLGFTHALVPPGGSRGEDPEAMVVVEVTDVPGAIRAAANLSA